jgi:hypothetical protein
MASKLAPIVASLSAVALILSGCGGGSDGKTHECKNSGFQLTSQKFTAPMTGTMHVETGNMTFDSKLNGKLVSKVDHENVNLREDFTDVDVQITQQGKTEDVKVNIKSFVSLDKGLAAFSADGSYQGTKMQKCMWVNITKFLNAKGLTKDMVKTQLNALLTAATANVKCSSNDGTYDKYMIDQQSPVPSVTGDAKVTLLTDANYMVHSMTSEVNEKNPSQKVQNQTIPGSATKETLDLTVDGGVATKGGPDDGDLSYASWGNCTEVPVPPTGIKGLHDSLSQVFANKLPGVKVRVPSIQTASVLAALDKLPKQDKPESTLVKVKKEAVLTTKADSSCGQFGCCKWQKHGCKTAEGGCNQQCDWTQWSTDANPVCTCGPSSSDWIKEAQCVPCTVNELVVV